LLSPGIGIKDPVYHATSVDTFRGVSRSGWWTAQCDVTLVRDRNYVHIGRPSCHFEISGRRTNFAWKRRLAVSIDVGCSPHLLRRRSVKLMCKHWNIWWFKNL